MEQKIIVRVAHSGDISYAIAITDEMESSAKARGTGIAKRSPEYVAKKIDEGKAVIAHTEDGTWVGFCYIEAWQHGQFVANSGLIVSPPFPITNPHLFPGTLISTISIFPRENIPVGSLILGLAPRFRISSIDFLHLL